MNLRKLILTENACYKAGRKITVSYTHLDVYKRQGHYFAIERT